MSHRIFVVDVFAEQPYSGNPLAVVLDASDLSDQAMLRIAAEMNFSETTFVSSTPDEAGAYPVRLFTPAREIDFAGHPILGTAWVVRAEFASAALRSVSLRLRVGRIPVSFEADPDGGEVAWFRAPPAELGACCEPDAIARALGIAPGDIADFPPVQRVAAGTAAMIVPLRGLDALRRASLDLNHYAELLERGFPPLTYLFCGETRHPGNDLSARFFFEAHGVREDPATGNGAAFLGAYLLRHAPRPGAELSLRIEQGHELGRPSLVLLRAGQAGAGPDIRVGGRVFPILRGELG